MEQDPPAITSQPPDEETRVDRAIELRAMTNMLRRADGFTLAFAQCNQPVECRKLVSELREILGDYPIAEIEFAGSIEHLLDELIPLRDEYKDARALFIYGLEHSIYSDREFSLLVANLNLSRNSFPLHISCSMILWLPAYATTAVLRGAPDFFSWRSALFQFPSPPAELVPISQDALSDGVLSNFNLTLEEKQERIAVIEGLLTDYGSLPVDKRDHRTESSLFYRLANLHYSLGDYGQAEESSRQSLTISKELADKRGIAKSLHQLGYSAFFQGDYQQAGEYYKQSLIIYEELDDKSGIAKSLHWLGNIACVRGDYDQAGEYYKQSLTIKEELGDKRGISYSLGQLGNIAYSQGDCDQAGKYYQQSLTISEELGDKSGIIKALHQLGNIAYSREDYVQAGEYYQQSLTISEELGDKSGIAKALHQLGILYVLRADARTAIRIFAVAHDIFAQINSPDLEQASNVLTRLQEEVEQDVFEALVKEAQTDPERVIREVLDSRHSG